MSVEQKEMIVMELVVGSVEVEKKPDGTEVPVKINRFVSFSGGNGQKILMYPWEALKGTVLEWMKIEEGEK